MMAKKLYSPFLSRQARVEMASLMDVMFLVLVFFVYSSLDMAVHRGLKVDLPSASGAVERGRRAIVTIAADGSVQFDGKPSDVESAARAAAELAAADPGFSVLVSADRSAPLGAGVELLDAMRRRGVEKASFRVSGARRGAEKDESR